MVCPLSLAIFSGGLSQHVGRAYRVFTVEGSPLRTSCTWCSIRAALATLCAFVSRQTDIMRSSFAQNSCAMTDQLQDISSAMKCKLLCNLSSQLQSVCSVMICQLGSSLLAQSVSSAATLGHIVQQSSRQMALKKLSFSGALHTTSTASLMTQQVFSVLQNEHRHNQAIMRPACYWQDSPS